MYLAEKLRITPFARILILFAVGIVLSRFVSAPLYIVIIVATIIYICAWRFRNLPSGGWYIAAAIIITGILTTTITLTKENMPRGEKLYITAEIAKTPYVSGRWQRTTAFIGQYRIYDDTTWSKTDEKVELYIDTCYKIYLGEQITASTYINPIDTTGSRYGDLMRSRGISSRAYIVPGSLIAKMEATKHGIRYYSGKMQTWMTDRIDRLNLNNEDKSMVQALVAGNRTSMDRSLKNAYARTGVSHILSVSGLHTGFVFIIINLLFCWTALFRRGHIIKNIIVIIAIWIYAMCTGLSPSVIRAAMMLTATQIALWGSIQGNGYNIVLACATFMLAVNPFYLFDVSFQLSFMAVLSIIFFYPRIYRRVISRNRAVDTLLSTILIGVAAQIGVLPIVAYNFENIPIISLLINPVIILTSFVIILFGIIWVILPLSFINSFISWMIHICINAQNGTVLWANSTRFAALENINFPAWGVALFYLILGCAAIAIKVDEERNILTPKIGKQ